MFWSKKPDPNPLGVPLGDLQAMLQQTTIKADIEGNALLARHEHYTIRIEVVPPESRESPHGPIRAVVRMVTELPRLVAELFENPETTVEMNAFAGLSALCAERGRVYIGSRLTIYEADDAWRPLHFPLLGFSAICGTEAILGGMRRAFTKEGPRGGESEWTGADFALVHRYLARHCACNADGQGLSMEIGLAGGQAGAAAGDPKAAPKSALFQLMADVPHPELGGGLFCLLQMPHQLEDKRRLRQLCAKLNTMEMAPHDLPPHFGAWCEGRLGNNPAYVSFFPNLFHSVSGIAVNAAFWAIHRALWANAMLPSLGVKP